MGLVGPPVISGDGGTVESIVETATAWEPRALPALSIRDHAPLRCRSRWGAARPEGRVAPGRVVAHAAGVVHDGDGVVARARGDVPELELVAVDARDGVGARRPAELRLGGDEAAGAGCEGRPSEGSGSVLS